MNNVGDPCRDCRTPMIPGKNGGAYCKPCYVKWAESKKQQPQSQLPLHTGCEETFAKMREAFLRMHTQIEGLRENFLRLQKQIDDNRQLLIDLRGKDAVELHESFDTPKKFDFKKAEKILQDPENFMTEHQEENMADSLAIDVPAGL